MGLTKQQMTMVVILLSGALLAVLNQTLLSPALPSIMHEFSIDATTVQWLLSAYSLVEAMIIPLSAYLVGRFSSRKLFIGGFTMFTLGSILAAWGPAFWVVLVGRILQAICTGVVMPLVFNIILLVFPREKRGAAMGIVGLIIGFAPAVGPALSGVLIDSVGWHMLFVIVTVLSLFLLVFAVFKLENFGEFDRAAFDPLSVVLISVGLVCLLYGLASFSSADNMAIIAALIVVGLVLVALFVRRQLALENPMLQVTVLKSHQYRTAVLVVIILQATLLGLAGVLPLFIQNVCGYSATVSGFTLLPGAVLGAVTSMLSGRAFDRFGARGIVTGGLSVTLIGAVLLFVLGADASFIAIGASYSVLIIGLQASTTPTNTWGLNSLDNRVIQHANALSNTLNQVAASFGTAALISISAVGASLTQGSPTEKMYVGYHMSFGSVVVLVAIGLLLAVLFVKDKSAAKAKTAEVAAPAAPTDNVLTVSDAMNAAAASLPQTATVRDALLTLAETESSGLPVVDSAKTVVGYISDGDIMKYLGRENTQVVDPALFMFSFADDENLQGRLVEMMNKNVMDLATKQVISVEADMGLEDACRVLAERRIKKVPVVDNGKLVGALSRRNIIRGVVNHLLAAE